MNLQTSKRMFVTLLVIVSLISLLSCDKNKMFNEVLENDIDSIGVKFVFMRTNPRDRFDTIFVLKTDEEKDEFKGVFGEEMKYCLCVTPCELLFYQNDSIIGTMKFSGASGYSLINFRNRSYINRISVNAMKTINNYSDLIRDKRGRGWRLQ